MTRRAPSPASRSAALVLVAVLASACGGPQEPLEVGVREVASDIVLGRQGSEPVDRPVASPIPPAPVAVNIPTPVLVPAPPRFEPTPTPSPFTPLERCPATDPLSVPRFGATQNEGVAPVEEQFTFRNEGEFTVTGANANEGVFEEESPRGVSQVVVDPDTQDVTYDVVANLGGTATLSSYLLRNTRPVDDGLGLGDQAGLDQQRGLYLTRVVTRLPDDRILTFSPATPLRLLRFPAVAGDTFDEVATDPVSGTTMQYTATVVGKVRVPACGEFVEAIQVALTDGRVDGPDSNVEFAATYDIAPQYGGLIVRDRVAVSGREGLDQVTRTNVATINRVPTHVTEVGTS